ncbi:pyridoxal phosphate-dependent transferase [Bisporella sp. PMI_857]|nr:pyridoxal phosphate-dependent transferase [Bisporella sp. PMI_857]
MANQLSYRGNANVSKIMPKIPQRILSAGWVLDSDSAIDLSMAENCTIFKIPSTEVGTDHALKHLDFPKGFWGDPELLRSLAGVFNKSFNPWKPVLAAYIAVAPGAGGCIDALLFNICDAHDGVLVSGPYWNGYNTFTRFRADVENKLHLISDEVFGPLTFESPDLLNEQRFASVLELDCETLCCDPSRVHMIWSPSKVFALSGVRLGCTVTQANQELHNDLSLASFTTVSILYSLLTTGLLKSPRLDDLLAVSSQRHRQFYIVLTTWLKKLGLPYLPCNAAPFLMAKIVPNASSWEDEATVVHALKEVDNWVSFGRSQHMPEYAKRLARLTFTIERAKLDTALARIEPTLLRMMKVGV